MGPTLPLSRELHQMKYRAEGESFREATARIANALKDSPEHFEQLKEALREQRILPAGRVQASVGAARAVTPYNCFVADTIDDSMDGIMLAAWEAATTMRLGGGIGYDFSTLRPRRDLIASLDSQASGPVSFMCIFDAVCKTIASAGHRRGAQMAVLRVDHPDIEEFVKCKNNGAELNGFNISVGITDEFMRAVEKDEKFNLTFNGKVYKSIRAKALWEDIMRSTWDWAEPGVLFIDRINEENNLYYCETISATNPCGEQPLPPYGACLLGSMNLVKYVKKWECGTRYFDYVLFGKDVWTFTRALDNVIDDAIYPLAQQREEAINKRRMGIGVTGLANAGEALGAPYGSLAFLQFQNGVMKTLCVDAYTASVALAKEKGPFPAFDAEKYCASPFIKRLPEWLQEEIRRHGIRNSHLTSIAPTGTISLTADNVSSGIEPVFSLEFDRVIQTFDGCVVERVPDYGVRVFGVEGKTADRCTPKEHLDVLLTAQKWVDSACSKTCNIGADVSWDDFKQVYMDAWKGGAKGCTTFRSAGKRAGLLTAVVNGEADDTPMACTIDSRGNRTCE